MDETSPPVTTTIRVFVRQRCRYERWQQRQQSDYRHMPSHGCAMFYYFRLTVKWPTGGQTEFIYNTYWLDRQVRESQAIDLLLSHAHFVEVVPVADDFAGGCLCVGFVEDYGVCLLRGFARRRVQIKLAFPFTLDHSTGDVSLPGLDRRPRCLREGNCYQNEEKRG